MKWLGRTPKKAGAIFFAVVVVALAVVCRPAAVPVQVVGELPPADVSEIQRLVGRDIRGMCLPKLKWETLLHPRTVLAGLAQFRRMDILWMKVDEDGAVHVYVGDDRKAVVSEGWEYILRNDPEWQICGNGYWGSSLATPVDLRAPGK